MILIAGSAALEFVLWYGVSYYSASGPLLLVNGFGLFVIALISGSITFEIVQRKNELPIALLSLLVILKSFLFINSGYAIGPIWFEVVTAINLTLGLWVGRFFRRILNFNLA
jgi:hypothetical protein